MGFPLTIFSTQRSWETWSSRAAASTAARAGQSPVFSPLVVTHLGKECGAAAENNGIERRILLMPAALMQNQISFLDFYFLL